MRQLVPRFVHVLHGLWALALPAVLWLAFLGRRDAALAHMGRLWWVLAAVAAAAGLYLYGFWRKRRALRAFASDNVLVRLMPHVSGSRQAAKAWLTIAALVCIGSALLGPRWGTYWQQVQQKGIDIMVVLDVSRSMLAEDVAPNRLERAKLDLEDLLTILEGDRIGLITFAGVPVLKCPLTPDYGFFRLILDDVDITASPKGGTLIGDAIRLAARSFDDKIKKHKVILLITDGEDHDSYPLEAAKDAYEQHGIRIYTVGLGDATQGTRIPVRKVGGKTLYLTYEGQEVFSKMNPTVLQEIAVLTRGAYVPAGTRSIDLDEIYKQHIAKLEQREFTERKVERRRARFQWFVAAGLVLLLAETCLPERRRKPWIDERMMIAGAT